MDASRFDQLTLTLARPESRRTLVQSLAGVAIGGILGSVGGAVDARRKRNHGGSKSRIGAEKKKGKKKKNCKSGTSKCGKACVNLRGDRRNCGRCGQQCGVSEVCDSGACIAGCTVCAAGCSFSSVKSAVAGAPEGEPILVAPGTYDADIIIDRDVTIRRCGDGGEVILRNASNRGRALTVGSEVTVALEQLTISRNPAHEFGGGVVNSGVLSLDQCTVRGRVGHEDDNLNAGVGNRGELTLTRSTISDNAPRGIHNQGPATLVDCTIEANPRGGLYSRDARLTITGCTFKDNDGTALYSERVDAMPTITVSDSLFEGNTSNQAGGILSSGELTVRDSVFRGNDGGSEGGAIVSFGKLTLERCEIDGNTSRAVGGGLVVTGTATISECDISENQSGTGGGIICKAGVVSCDDNGCTGGSQLTVTDSIIRDNAAVLPANISEGGGVQINGWCAATFKNCAITGNTIGDHGGGMNVSPNGNVVLEHCTINGNHATGDSTPVGAEGGGIYNQGRVTFRSGELNEINGNDAYAGGGIYNDGGELTIASCEISANEVQTSGGGLYSSGGSITFVAGGGSSVTGNIAGISGGGIALRQSATIALNDTVVSDNEPDECSAAVPIEGCPG